MIDLKNVSKSIKKSRILSDVSFVIEPGEFVCITGPSGAGKTTLMHILAGADEVTSGEIRVDGVNLRSVPPLVMLLFRRRVGVVFQDFKLLPHFTVKENIAFPLEVSGASDEDIEKRTAELLKRMKLTRQADTLPQEISGGEKARTAIARAIANFPMVIIADEPTGNLDPEESIAILKLLKEINNDGTTVVLATHDSAIVDAASARVIRLEEGRIVRDEIGGGYIRKKQSENLEILEEEEKEPAPKKTSKIKEQSKVKITSIGS